MITSSYKNISIKAVSFLVCLLMLPGARLALSEHFGPMTASVRLFTPAGGDRVGLGGMGWFVDLALDFDVPLERTGFTGFQLTGPGVHNNVAPMPGTFSPGADDRVPGLMVFLSTTQIGARSCQNLANLFNMLGVTDVAEDAIELWDTWIIGGPNFGVETDSEILVAIAADHNHDGVFNDAPDVLPDADANGVCNQKDLKAFGAASNIEHTTFFING